MRKILLKGILILLVILMSGCSNRIRNEEAPQTEVYFCTQDDCADKIIGLINSSEEIKCAFYNMNIESLANLLEQKKAIFFENERKEGLMHNKFCVLDGYTIITGSFNPTEQGKKDYNNVLVITVDHKVKNIKELDP